MSNFEVVRLLGEGGMGAVYEGKHPVIDKRVAIKVLKPERSVDPELVERFLNEARATSAIRHPNIVEVMDLGTLPSGAPYLVMELLEGETLGDRLERVGRLELEVALDFARQTASALGAAHARGIVHRDLKPDNVFLVPDPRMPDRELVKVLDFGIAKLRGELTAAPVHTLAGALLGTPSYMSPEQCRGVPEQLDHRTDIYALGVMLYEMVCGSPPFVSDALGDTMMMHMSMPPPPPASLGVELPEEVERVILRALAKRPEQRFASMAELRAALETAPSSVVMLPAAVHVGERSAARVFASGVRGGVPGPRVVEMPIVERTRPVSGSGPRRAPARLAEETTEPTALAAELMSEHAGGEAAAQRTRRDDSDTAPGSTARTARRRIAFAGAALLCAVLAAAGWLLPRLGATEPASAVAVPGARAPAQLAAAQRPATSVNPSVPIAAVVPPPPAPVAESVASASTAAQPRADASNNSQARTRRPRLSRATRATVEADPAMSGAAPALRGGASMPAAPTRAAVDKAFTPVAAADDWRAEAGESVAASAPSAAPSRSASQPPADSLTASGAQARKDSPAAPQLAALSPKAKNAPELPLASRAPTGAAAKSSATPPTTEGRVMIEDLQVRGPLPASLIRRGIERARADFESCYRKAAGSAGRAGLGRVGVSFELDELGRVRNASASGSTVASLDRCVADATRRIAARGVPDTGIVRGSFQLVLTR